jgi:hypothetical protein
MKSSSSKKEEGVPFAMCDIYLSLLILSQLLDVEKKSNNLIINIMTFVCLCRQHSNENFIKIYTYNKVVSLKPLNGAVKLKRKGVREKKNVHGANNDALL